MPKPLNPKLFGAVWDSRAITAAPVFSDGFLWTKKGGLNPKPESLNRHAWNTKP